MKMLCSKSSACPLQGPSNPKSALLISLLSLGFFLSFSRAQPYLTLWLLSLTRDSSCFKLATFTGLLLSI